MFCAVAPATVSPSCEAVMRCQFTPSRDIQITAWCPPPLAVPLPAARNPSGVFATTSMLSPGSCGLIPWVAASVQDWPVWLVQTACGPSAIHPAGPPAIRMAASPSGGWPPPGS